MAEEGATPKSQSDEKDKIIAALLTANSNHEKHIKLLEKQLVELENKVMAPIRNDAAFLLRLSEIRQSEWEVKDASHQTIQNFGRYGDLIKDCISSKMGAPKEVQYINKNFTLYIGDYNLLATHKSLFSGTPDAIDYLKYFCIIPIMYDKNYKDISHLILKTCSNSIEKKIDFNLKLQAHKIKLNIGKNPKGERRLWLEIETTSHPSFVIIELDDLSDKELIEKMYKKENLLE